MEGVEHGGHSVLDDDTAALTVDWPKTGEGATISSNPDFSGVGLFYRSDIGVYRDSIGMFTTANDDRVFLKITDTTGKQRALFMSQGTEQPKFQQFDKDGNQIE